MTLQVLRNQVGDRDFFRILRAWARKKAGGNGTTGQFIALAERISGQQLDDLFQTWLFTAGKPALDAVGATQATARVSAAASGGAARIPPVAAMLLERISKGPLRLSRTAWATRCHRPTVRLGEPALSASCRCLATWEARRTWDRHDVVGRVR